MIYRLVVARFLDFWLLFFFFSSRRRHTRWNCDWSSDVCSSDLNAKVPRLLVVSDPILLLCTRAPLVADHTEGSASVPSSMIVQPVELPSLKLSQSNTVPVTRSS